MPTSRTLSIRSSCRRSSFSLVLHLLRNRLLVALNARGLSLLSWIAARQHHMIAAATHYPDLDSIQPNVFFLTTMPVMFPALQLLRRFLILTLPKFELWYAPA